MLVILSAAMSTLSSQFHTTGTAVGRDFYEQLSKKKQKEGAVTITKIGIFASLLVTVLLALKFEGNIIARATSIFFGVMASAFLAPYRWPSYWKKN
jgi:SSS family solute:Na+ symporter